MRTWLLLMVVGLALAARLWAAVSLRFDGLYGQDPYAYYYHGLSLWRDHALTYHWPWLPAPLRLYWPLGEPALLALAFAAGGQARVVVAQGVDMLAGLGVVVLVYLLTLRVAGAILPARPACWAAALAAALCALAGLQVQASDTIMADAPALFWGTAAVYLWILPGTAGVERQRGRIWPGALPSIGAGCCLGLATSTRWEYAALAPALALYWWLQRLPSPGVRAPGAGKRAGPAAGAAPGRSPRRAAPVLLLGLAGALLTGLPQLLYSISYSDPVLHHQWLTGWSPAHVWQSTFSTVDGTQRYSLSAGAFYLLQPLLSRQFLPATLLPFLPAGILALASRRGRGGPMAGGLPLLGLLLAWWLVPALYLSGVPFESARFALIYAPPLAVLESAGLAAVVCYARRALAVHDGPGTAAAQRTDPAPPWAAPALGAVWALLGLAILASAVRTPLSSLAQGKAHDLDAVHWLALHTPPGAQIATFGLTLTLYHYGDPAGHHWTLADLSALSPADLRRLAGGRVLVAAANTANLSAQWRGLPPAQALEYLLAHAGLRSVATVGGYTMFVR